jgi:hypothetical protein
MTASEDWLLDAGIEDRRAYEERCSLPDYDEGAATLLKERALRFLDEIGSRAPARPA